MPEVEKKIPDRVIEEYRDFRKMKELHTRPFQQFNSAYDGSIRSLRDYIEYSFAKFNQFVEIPEDSEDYEIHLKLPHLRNKLMAVIARLTAQRMKVEVHAQNVEQKMDKMVSKFLGQLLEWSDETSGHDKAHFYWMLETAMKGTGILSPDYFRHAREIKDIKELDPQTGKRIWKKKKIIEDGCSSQVIPLEEFFIWNVREPDIEKQHKVIWATVMPLEDFNRIFEKYPRSKEVVVGGHESNWTEVFYKEFLSGLSFDMVEVLRIFNQTTDEFKIIANGIELTEEDNPIPFKHKKAPFVAVQYEPIQADFFYGKSLVDKGGNIADAIDQLFNDLFNRNQMTLKAPLIAKQGSVLQDTIWRPDSVIWYTGEKPERLEVTTTSQDTDRLYNILTDQLNVSTVSPVLQGSTGSGSTAREVILAQENANELMSMFQRMMEWGEKKRAEMTMSNLLQFMTVPQEISNVEPGLIRTFFQHGVQLESGKFGTREIRLKRQSAITPPEMLEKEFAEDKEIIEVPIELVHNLKYYIRVVPNSSIKISQALKKTLEVEYTTTMAQLFPDLINQRELAAGLTEAFEKNPDRMLMKEQEGDGMEEQLSRLLEPVKSSTREMADREMREESVLPALPRI